jgi:hypothetical protein
VHSLGVLIRFHQLLLVYKQLVVLLAIILVL